MKHEYPTVHYERLSCANHFIGDFGPEYGGVHIFWVIGTWGLINELHGPVVEIVDIGGFEGSRLCIYAEEIL